MTQQNYIVGSIPHQDEFLHVPGAKVMIDNQESGCNSVEFANLANRIASAQPHAKIKYFITIES